MRRAERIRWVPMAGRLALSLAVPLVLCVTLLSLSALDRGVKAEPLETAADNVEGISKPVVSVISEDFSGPLRQMTDDLAAMFAKGRSVSVLPVFGVGDHGRTSDLYYLRAIDVALVHSDLPVYAKRHVADGNFDSRLRYIARLFEKDLAIVAGPEIRSVSDLAGRKVSTNYSPSSSASTAANVLELLGIEVTTVQYSGVQALEKVKSGEVAAAILVDDTPNALLATVRPEDVLHLVPIEPNDALRSVYAPKTLTSDDYPNLIAPGQTVSSLSVSVVMAMYNWPPSNGRYDRVKRFVDEFLSGFAELQGEAASPKWKSVDVSATVPGWTRFKPAEDWLRRGDDRTGSALAHLRVVFKKFLAYEFADRELSLDEAEEYELFRQFLAWSENPDEANIDVYLITVDGVSTRVGVIRARNTEVSIGANTNAALLLRPEIEGLAPSRHAIRIHENASCEAGTRDGAPVRGLGAGDVMRGDGYENVPMLNVAANGSATETMLIPGLNLASLLNRAIVVYEGEDAATAPLACGKVD